MNVWLVQGVKSILLYVYDSKQSKAYLLVRVKHYLKL